MPDLGPLTNLPLGGLFAYLVLIAAFDVAFNIVLALARNQFSGAYVADYLRTHILERVFVIGALGVLGHGVEAVGIPAIPAVSLAASASLAAYIVETIASLRAALTSTTPG